MTARRRHRLARTDYTIDSVARALELLQAFNRPPHRFSLTELARELDVTVNLAFRLVKTLELKGFVHRIEDKYVLGIEVTGLGRVALHRFDALRAVAQPLLDELMAAAGETAYLTARDGMALFCAGVAEVDDSVRGVLEVGVDFPFHGGAGPKVILAHMTAQAIESVIEAGLPARTKKTITDPAALRANLAKIRKNGYEVSVDELKEWSSGIAAPIFAASGTVDAAIGVVGPTPRILQKQAALVREVVEIAGRASAALGHDPSSLRRSVARTGSGRRA